MVYPVAKHSKSQPALTWVPEAILNMLSIESYLGDSLPECHSEGAEFYVKAFRARRSEFKGKLEPYLHLVGY